MKLIKIFAALCAAVVLLVGCGSQPTTTDPSAGSSGDLLDRHGLTGMSAEQVIDQLDRSTQSRPTQLGGSVRPDQLLLTDGSQEAILPLPDDKFYLAIAPFLDRSHECHFHSLGTCQGELVGEAVHVTITTVGGEALVDEEAVTWMNGFVGYWVPKGSAGTITVDQGGKQGSVSFTTGEQDATCVTTLQLV